MDNDDNLNLFTQASLLDENSEIETFRSISAPTLPECIPAR